jgi:hypothetical protein
VHRYHLPAHRGLVDFAATVGSVTLPHRTIETLSYDFPLFQFPIEEALPGIAGPQSPIAIKGRDTRLQAHNRIEKSIGSRKKCVYLCGVHVLTIT